MHCTRLCTLRCADAHLYTCVHAYRIQAAPKSPAQNDRTIGKLTSYEFPRPRECRQVSGLPPARSLRFLHDLVEPPFVLTRRYRAREFRRTLPRLLKRQMLMKIRELSANREITGIKGRKRRIPGRPVFISGTCNAHMLQAGLLAWERRA